MQAVIINMYAIYRLSDVMSLQCWGKAHAAEVLRTVSLARHMYLCMDESAIRDKETLGGIQQVLFLSSRDGKEWRISQFYASAGS